MKLVCVNNIGSRYNSNGEERKVQYRLTIGKVYEDMSLEDLSGKKYALIENDDGNKGIFESSLFISIDEWRDRKISELLNK